MSCCCSSSDKNNGKSSRTTGAPSKQAMGDRGTINDDKRAVDWWRTHQQEKGETDDQPGGSSFNSQDRLDRGVEGSMTRVTTDASNPLETPYQLEGREKPLQPQDGDILQPGKKNIRGATKPPPPKSNGVQVLRPSMDPGIQPTHSTTLLDRDSSGRLEVVAPATQRTPRTKRDPPDHKVDPKARYSHKGSLILTDKALAKASKKSGSAKKGFSPWGRRGDTEESDHLSDVGSDVDSVTKERYLLACHMLKSSLTEKEKNLEPLEKEFILSLLGDYDNDRLERGSVISEGQLSAVEQTAMRLQNDPLFQTNEARSPSKGEPPSPLTAASLQTGIPKAQNDTGLVDIPKHPHTATRAKPRTKTKSLTSSTLSSFFSNACNPMTAEEAGAADIALSPRGGSNDMEDTYSPSNDSREARRKGLVRFDGWSSYRANEYPFRILSPTKSPSLAPRVLTPANMEALRGFLPVGVSENNFWLKYSLARDGASLTTLLATVRASSYTIIGVETNYGEVFGSFTGSPWRTGSTWFGTGEAFLWRLKKPRFTSRENAKQTNFENEMEVYPFTGYDDLVQYCTARTIAVGGGDWGNNPSPFAREPKGIGFMIDGDLMGGETNSCATFANPRLCKKVSTSNEFSISNLEVWTLTPCLNIEDAARLEVQKMFVKENTQVTSTMAGF